MKTVFAIILALSSILGLCACDQRGVDKTQSAPAKSFQVGYAREDIMPNNPVGMHGFANAGSRRSSGYKDTLYTTCLAFSQGDDTVLMFSVDIISIDAGNTRKIRKELYLNTGVPEDRIMICATHTHSGPAYSEKPYFEEIFLPAFVNAAKNALADLAPATMYGTKTLAENMSFVRHYITTDGQYVDNSGAAKNPSRLAKHARETDPEMLVIKFDREGNKKDISLINWQCHPCFSSDKDTLLSADFIATVRSQFEEKTGMQVVYFSGASGDLGASSKLPSEPKHSNQVTFGGMLANKAIAAIDGEWTKIEGSGIRTVQNHFEYATNRVGIERIEEALKVKEYAEKVGSYERAEVNHYAKEMGFASARECLTIVMNADKPEKLAMELNALYLGGLVFVTAPYEMYAQDGVFIKQNSPFEFTIISSLSNDYYHYFPKKEAYDSENSIYEVVTADFASGVAEATADQFVSMLKSL